MSKIIINTEQAPAAIGTYSQAVQVGDTVYLSGQIPLVPATMQMVSEDFAEQADQVFKKPVCCLPSRWWQHQRHGESKHFPHGLKPICQSE